jgi:hypothetical protein
MTTMLLTVVIFLLAVLGLAVGVMLHRSPIKGSCGGCAACLYKRGKTRGLNYD